jgi:hypothetical protein
MVGVVTGVFRVIAEERAERNIKAAQIRHDSGCIDSR